MRGAPEGSAAAKRKSLLLGASAGSASEERLVGVPVASSCENLEAVHAEPVNPCLPFLLWEIARALTRDIRVTMQSLVQKTQEILGVNHTLILKYF
jgi:hypothetical protein